jgi:hypothetical protein
MRTGNVERYAQKKEWEECSGSHLGVGALCELLAMADVS